MGSLLSKAQKEEETRQDNSWKAQSYAESNYDTRDYYANQMDLSRWRETGRESELEYLYSASDQPTPKEKVTFKEEEVALNKGKVVYCSGPHRNADSSKAFIKDKHKTKLRPSDIDISIHYFEPGNYQAFKTQNIKRWTPFKFDKRRRYATGPGVQEVDVITLTDAKERNDMEISWREFISNFTPFSEEQSKPSTRESRFDTASWTVGHANPKPRSVPLAPPQPREYYDSGSGRHHHRR